MKKTRVITALILTVLMLVSLTAAACSAGKDKENKQMSTDAEKPEATAENQQNTAEPPYSDEPITPEETEVPDDYFYANLEENVPLACDLDFDGKEDTVMLVAEESQYGKSYSMQFTLGYNPNNTISLDFDYESYFCTAFITDSDRFDSRLDVIASFGYESDDYSTCLYRVDKTGYNIDYFEEYAYVQPIGNESGVFAKDGQFYLDYRTEILGTMEVSMLCEACESGINRVGDRFYYSENELPVNVITEISVELIDENEGITGNCLLMPGTKVVPLETDCATYVIVRLENGDCAKIELELVDDWYPLINGQPQEYYFEVHYAD